MKNIKSAFTMIELVFVIVVLGILSAVVIPKLSPYINDANYAKALATVSTIRSAISSERQSSMMKGSPKYPLLLDDAGTGDHEELFDGNSSVEILQYPIYSGSKSGNWKKTSGNSGATITYKYYMDPTTTVTFTYTKATGTFDCDHSDSNCKLLAE